MFDKRLLSLVDGSSAIVVFKWLGLVANIVLFVALGLFVQGVVAVYDPGFQGVASVFGIDSVSSMCLIAVCLAALLVRIVAMLASQRMGAMVAGSAKKSIRNAIYRKLLRLGPSYREGFSSSNAMQIAVEGVEQLEVYFGSYLPQLFYALLAPLTLFAALSPLSLSVSAVLLVCVPLIPGSIMMFQKVAKRVMRRYWGSYLNLGEGFLENIQGLTTLKVYRADAARHEAMNQQAEGFRRATMRVLRLQLNSITIMDLLAYGGAAVGILLAVHQFLQGSLGLAAAFAIVFLSAEFFLPMRALGSLFHTAMNGMSAADRMFELLEVKEPSVGGVELEGRSPEITCFNVGYTYDCERQVLRGVDFYARPGEFVALVGESGSGKSTLAGIISGSLAGFSGEVCVCGVPVTRADRASLSRMLTRVGFDSVLFKGSVRDNLLIASPAACDSALIDALQSVKAWDFVLESGGLDMQIAEGASNLSGGQRQRLALARAFLHDSPIYLFDEVTSSIDAESEAAVLEGIRLLARRGKTIVMITHRMSSISHADRIFVLKDGVVAQSGKHDFLMGQSGPYRMMVEKQLELESLALECQAEAADCDEGFEGGLSCGGVADGASAGSWNREVSDPVREGAASSEAGASQSSAARNGRGSRKSILNVVFRMIGIVAPLAWCMLLAVLLGVAGFAASIAITVAAASCMGSFATGAAGTFAVLAVCVGASALLRGPLHYGEQICNHYIAFKLLALIRDRVFTAMRKLSPAKLEGRDKGDLVSLVTADIELLEVFYAHTISPVLIAVVMAFGLLVLLGLQSVWFALAAAVIYFLISVAVPYLSSCFCGSLGRMQRDAVGELNSFVLEGLRGINETIQYGQEDARADSLDSRMDSLQKLSDKLAMRTAVADAAIDVVVLLGDVVFAILGSHLLASGIIGLPQFLFALALLMSGFGPFFAVSRLGAGLQRTLASGQRVIELLDETPVTEEAVSGVEVQEFAGCNVRDVCFGYKGVQILSNANMRILPNQIVQIRGRSGSGKSTLCKLLMRFWDPDSGVIELNGCNLNEVSTSSLRNIQSYMTQETHLFSGTLGENIALVRPGATEAELLDACRKADILSLVERLPNGLQTQVGELGSSLSGGERQRIGLARVFLHDAPFVLLDEPTSNLDSLSEAQVVKALRDNRQGKTIVLVSHRASTSSMADAAFSVDCGRSS